MIKVDTTKKIDVTLRYKSGVEDKHGMDAETLDKFEKWLIDDASTSVFIYMSKSDYRCYKCYIFKSQIECVDYSK